MSWKRVRGHDAAKAFFRSAARRGRLGHAFLFVGPHGVGKRLFAVELAKALLCEKHAPSFEACDDCESCHLVDAGTHPDLFQVARPEGALEFPIKVVKEDLLPNLAMKPSRGGRKIAILDDADDLNEEAANSFLKTLEEPPPMSVLILVGGPNLEGQLPTILSRCQVVRFGTLAPTDVRQALQENEVTDPVRQERLLRIANGSPGEALALDDEEVWTFRGDLIKSLGQERIDPAATARQWGEFIDNAGKEAAAHRRRASLLIRMLLDALANALKLGVGNPIDGPPEESTALKKLSARLGEEKLLALIERVLEADRQVDRRVQLVLTTEGLAAALSKANQDAVTSRTAP